MKKKLKITHITTVHSRYDTRIFIKECCSLADEYDEVNLLVADGKGDEVVKNVHIFDLGRPLNRIERIKRYKDKALQKSLKLDSNIYHFHDPELITLGVKLQKKGKKVIYDVHEDVPRQILRKPYLNKKVKKIVSFLFEQYENYQAKKFSSIITSTDYIRGRFIKNNPNTFSIKNFPLKKEISLGYKSYENKTKNTIIYIGGITEDRGILEIIDSLDKTKNKVNLILAGVFHDQNLEVRVKKHRNWELVDYYGFVNRQEVLRLLSLSKIGIVTLHPIESYLTSLPIKMFEYMGAGLPVIASNFRFWQDMFEEDEVVFTNPTNSLSIAKSIDFLLDNKEIAQKMAKKSLDKINFEMNWEKESKKIFDLYQKISE